MEKYRKYYGVFAFIAVLALSIYVSYKLITPKIESLTKINADIEKKENLLKSKKTEQTIVMNKIKKIKDSIAGSQKKIYFPIESDLGNDTLFFTLYQDIIDMVHGNSIKIKKIDYNYNPASDEFVKFGKDVYFVCDIDMELVSNYVNLGKLIQEIYQYPYYIKINELNVSPYEKDKKLLISGLSLRLYAHTSPEEQEN